MTQRRRHVSHEAQPRERLPDWAARGALILDRLHASGQLAELADRLEVRREGGYPSLGLLVFAIYYFASGLRCGLKEFGRKCRPYNRLLAGHVGRRTLMSPSSASRFLAATRTSPVREFSTWLLREGVDITTMLRHPSTAERDTVGDSWHLFDWDPTVTVLRHRALPEGGTLPTARRRSETTTAPGYPGRKRGEEQFSRGTLQHAGSSAWLHLHAAAGNGEHRAASHAAMDAVVGVCHTSELSLRRAVIRADGAAGNVPFMTGCAERGLHWLTRIARYELFDDAAVREHLDDFAWVAVPDSRSGPTRYAAELGDWSLPPARPTRRLDGRPYAPIRTRVVATRYEADGGRGAGVLIDGWKYELFATSLPAEAWPAAQVVARYHGRAGLENRFSQEDRELGLDHVFSYHLPGQALMSAIGLFVWNFQLRAGFALEAPPDELPEQPRLAVEHANAGPALSGGSAAVQAKTTAASAAEPRPTPAPRRATASEDDAFEALRNELNAMSEAIVTTAGEGWSWDAERAGLRCPRGALAAPQGVWSPSVRRRKVRFAVRREPCASGCPYRAACTTSVNPQFQKRIDIAIGEPAERVGRLIKQTVRTRKILLDEDRDRLFDGAPHPRRRRSEDPPAAIVPAAPLEVNATADTTPAPAPPPETIPPSGPQWLGIPMPTLCGLLMAVPGVLLPAVLRHRFCRAAESAQVNVRVGPTQSTPKVVCYAATATQRQHRRLTREQHRARNALPSGTLVDIDIDVGDACLQKWVEEAGYPAMSAMRVAA